jgi:signal transduction histidine kinase
VYGRSSANGSTSCEGAAGAETGAIDAERRRIERDLHDGPQGRLVSLAMSLGLLEAKLASDPDAARPIARAAGGAVAATLDELRELSRGYILPPSSRLGTALTELCERAALSVDLEVSLDRRLPADVEAAGYFIVSEALTNAAKHAHATEARAARDSPAVRAGGRGRRCRDRRRAALRCRLGPSRTC